MADPAPLRLELVLRQSPVCGWIYCCFLPPDHCIGDIHSSCLSKTILHISISTSGSVRSEVFHAWGGFELQSPRLFATEASFLPPARSCACLVEHIHAICLSKKITHTMKTFQPSCKTPTTESVIGYLKAFLSEDGRAYIYAYAVRVQKFFPLLESWEKLTKSLVSFGQFG